MKVLLIFRWRQLYVATSAGIFMPLLMLLSTGLNGQSINRSLNDVSMPSANAVAYGKYGDIPVAQFTGVPNISIPITTLQEGPLSLPISLSYHASGIKVGELASWVGLGWNLNYGGQISRTVVGHPDEFLTGSAMGWLKGGNALTRQRAETELNAANNTALGLSLLATKYDQFAVYDTEPDIFSFTAGNYSGKFYFDANGATVLIPKQDLKVIKDSGDLNNFTIVTPDGTRYLYGKDLNDPALPTPTAYEIGYHGNTIQEMKQVWHLVKMEDYTRQFWIKWSYASEAYKYPSVASASVSARYESVGGEVSSGTTLNSNGTTDLPIDNSGRYAGANYVNVKESKRLSSITTFSGKTTLIFGATTNRTDLENVTAHYDAAPKRLDYIDVKTNAGEAYTKRFALNYDYLKDPNCTPTVDHYTKRLRLLSVQEKTATASVPQSLPPYQLEYEGNNEYPNRLSKAIDHWGFYNGKVSNNTNLINTPIPLVPNACNFPSGNRESNEEMMKKGVLKKITYPTGGFTSFALEANTVSSKDSTSNRILTVLSNNLNSTGCCGTRLQLTGSVNLPAQSLTNKAIRVVFRLGKPICSSACADLPWGKLSIYNSANTLVGSYEQNFNSTDVNTKCFDFALEELVYQTLPGGTYTFKLEYRSAFVSAEVWQNEYRLANRVVGGLRVKEMVSNDGSSSTHSLTTTYKYDDETTGISHGTLRIQPQYVSVEAFGGGTSSYGGQSIQIQVSLKTISSMAVVPLGDFSGYHVCYNKVTELKSGSGKTVSEFFIEYPTGIDQTVYQSYPYRPAPPTVKTGLLKSDAQSNASGQTVSSSMSEIDVAYPLSACEPFKLFKRNFTNVFYYKLLAYPLYQPSFIRLRKKTELKDGITMVTDNDYGVDEISLPTTTTTTNSDNTTHQLQYKYPHHFKDTRSGEVSDE
jgi:hypothetical protein